MPIFQDIYTRYMNNALAARLDNKLEQERKRLFFGFLQEAFGLQFEDVQIEKRVRLSNQQHGFVDAIFGGLVFEFKQDLSKQHRQTLDQLRDYLNSDQMRDDDYTGVLCDGLQFEIYLREAGELRLIDKFDLKPDQSEDAFARLDSYLFSQKAMRPTAQDIVARFGASSPSFRATFAKLRTLLGQTNYSALKVWREQWDKLLSKVYGDRVTGQEGDDLYLKHTYLCQFAKLLAYGALNGQAPQSADEVERIINGQAFRKDRVSNIGESDFFSWVLLDDIKTEALELFRRLGTGLLAYNLSQIDQDLLKQLYQNLVDPSTRHDLGEYYTPDWLAELVLEDINYAAPHSLLDPACGSGSFLFAAIKRLEQNGLTGAALVKFAADNIMGLDVHPLAVTVARLNYVLALSAALRERGKTLDVFPVPVYMADALQSTGTELTNENTFIIPVAGSERFSVPLNIARHSQHFGDIIDQMELTAKRAASSMEKTGKKGNSSAFAPYRDPFIEFVKQRSDPIAGGMFDDLRETLWNENFTLLATLISEGRNGIWAYILKNQARPLMLAERKFDCIVGNPPWLSYRYIKNKEYQAEVKRLSVEYGLIEAKDVKLFTQLELCTLFAVHAEQRYLKTGGTLAFVMPRSVITGAKQHRAFQAKGLTRVIDLLGVQPLFNVPSCVTIVQGGARTTPVPSRAYTGTLPRHEMSLADARPLLKDKPATVKFVDSEVRSSHYHALFQQGATLVPRNLVLVAPEGNPHSPMFVSDPDADKEAKAPYKGVKVGGHIDEAFLYATLLSKHLLPFGYEKLHLAALPVLLGSDGELKLLDNELAFFQHHHGMSWEWFEKAAQTWDKLGKGSMTFFEQLDYRKKLSQQHPKDGFRVLYNASGSNLAACVIDKQFELLHGRDIQAFIVDTMTYVYAANTQSEAHYLSALLNAPFVSEAIKAYQSSGSFGERHIHRTPFEACAIPPFDAANPQHQRLAQLSQDAHAAVAALKESGKLKGGVVAIRKQARAVTAAQLSAIDAIARVMLG